MKFKLSLFSGQLQEKSTRNLTLGTRFTEQELDSKSFLFYFWQLWISLEEELFPSIQRCPLHQVWRFANVLLDVFARLTSAKLTRSISFVLEETKIPILSRTICNQGLHGSERDRRGGKDNEHKYLGRIKYVAIIISFGLLIARRGIFQLLAIKLRSSAIKLRLPLRRSVTLQRHILIKLWPCDSFQIWYLSYDTLTQRSSPCCCKKD